eukprot:SAG22_NODE_5520_length_1000_cov_1.431743_1_plen_218_part_10
MYLSTKKIDTCTLHVPVLPCSKRQDDTLPRQRHILMRWCHEIAGRQRQRAGRQRTHSCAVYATERAWVDVDRDRDRALWLHHGQPLKAHQRPQWAVSAVERAEGEDHNIACNDTCVGDRNRQRETCRRCIGAHHREWFIGSAEAPRRVALAMTIPEEWLAAVVAVPISDDSASRRVSGTTMVESNNYCIGTLVKTTVTHVMPRPALRSWSLIGPRSRS